MRHSSIVPHWARPPLKSGVSYTAYLAYLNRASIHPKSSPIETIKARTKITIAIHVMQLLLWLFALAENTYMTTKLRRHPTEACHSKVPHWKCWSQLFGLFASVIAAGRILMRWTMAGGVAFLVDNEWSLCIRWLSNDDCLRCLGHMVSPRKLWQSRFQSKLYKPSGARKSG